MTRQISFYIFLGIESQMKLLDKTGDKKLLQSSRKLNLSFFTVIEHGTQNFGCTFFFGRRVADETDGRTVQKSLLLHVQILKLMVV